MSELQFRVLGPVEITARGKDILPTAPKLRQVMALLVLRRNRVVRTAELMDELWEGGPPETAVTTLQTYVYKLRKTLMEHGAAGILGTRPGGYLLEVPDSAIDLHLFEKGAADGRALLESGDAAGAAETLRCALAVWRGPVLADVTPGGLLTAYVAELEESRTRALELRIEADLRLGRHRELVSELKSLVLTHSLHEPLHAALMTALYRSGRRHEALETYHVLRQEMIEQVGLEPGTDLQRLHQELLADEPPAPRAGVVRMTRPVPRTAPPPDVHAFTGRAAELDRLTRVLTAVQGAGPRVRPAVAPVAVVSGMPGSGKTALAVHAAHRLGHRFGGGVLYACLDRPDAEPRQIRDVLGEFLRALDVREAEIPDGLEGRSRLFRATAAGRRVLVVIDGAPSLAAVRPALPEAPGCASIVTSRLGRRARAGGHPVDGVHALDLDGLDHADGVELLARLIGHDRVAREQAAAGRLVVVCGGLPLALCCAAAQLADAPGLSLARLAAVLTPTQSRLDKLRHGHLDVRAAYDATYSVLSPLERSTLRLLTLMPRTGFTLEAAAELLGWERAFTESVLGRLVEHRMLALSLDREENRYSYPELTWIYAGDRQAALLQRLVQATAPELTVVGDDHMAAG